MRRSKSTLLGLLLLAMVALFATSCRYANDASDTLFNETKASTLLKKYSWFKDAAANLNAKKASIGVYDQRFADLKDEYKGVARKDWAREDKEQWNTWAQEVAGLKASYNNLAGEYNAQMAKINWAFCNVGSLPAGATEPLPRSFAPYIDQ